MAEIGLHRLVVSRQVLDEAERNLRKKLPAALPVFAELMAAVGPEIVPDPSSEEIVPACSLTLDVKDLIKPVQVVEESGLRIETPAEFVQAVRTLIEEGLS
jgi:hypothetical protein